MISNPALGSFGNQTGEQFLAKLIPALVELILVVGFLAFLFTFLLGAIKWITSSGDKGKYEEAKQTLTNAVIGLVVLFMFWGILSLVECFFGIGLRQIQIAQYSIGFSGNPMCTGFTGGTGTGTGTGTGEVPGNPGGPGAGVGLSACGCINGGCATNGQIGLGNDGQCWTCSTSGWSSPQAGSCPPISCVATCN